MSDLRHTDEPDDHIIDVVARVINDEGWTCVAHEPLDYGDCFDCGVGQHRLAVQVINAYQRATDREVSDV